MAHEFINAFCKECGQERTFYRRRINHLLHFVLSVLTGGLWLVSWVSLILNHKHLPWTCGACETNLLITSQKSRDSSAQK